MDYGQIILAWKAHHHPYYQRSIRWYMVAGVITVMFVLYAIFTQAITMAIVFIVLAGVYFLIHRREPEVIDNKLTTMGIQSGDTFHPYADIKAFYIIHEPPYVSTLNIFLENKMNNEVTFQLEQVDVSDVREVLLNRGIQEVQGREESFTSIISRILGL